MRRVVRGVVNTTGRMAGISQNGQKLCWLAPYCGFLSYSHLGLVVATGDIRVDDGVIVQWGPTYD